MPDLNSNVESTKPLCIDLDGTLVKTNTLLEGLIIAAKSRPTILVKSAFHLFRYGRASFKTVLGDSIRLDTRTLPYHSEVLQYAREERLKGRIVLLTTGASESWAQAIADELGCFDGVIGTTKSTNLISKNKAEALVLKYGQSGFDYVGDSRQDHAVWQTCDRKMIVSNGSDTRYTWAKTFSRRAKSIPELILRSMRPHQWAKNLLVFIPLLLAHKYHLASAWLSAAFTFVSFCLCASELIFSTIFWTSAQIEAT